MSAPPVPPRPYDFADPQRSGSLPPPVPPPPPNLHAGGAQYNPYESSGSLPHFERPLIAPRPHRLDPSIPANMARNLDDQVSQQYRQSYAAPHPPPPPPLHAQASYPGYTTQNPNPPNPANWSPWAHQQGSNSARPQFPDPAEVSKSIANLSLVSSPISIPAPPMSAPPSQFAARPAQVASPASAVASLTAPLPLLSQLESATNIIQQPSHDPTLKISWCRDILFLVERQRHDAVTPSTDPIIGPVQITDPALARLAPIAVRLILQLSGSQPPVQGVKLPPHVSEAIFHRATLAASGAFPEFIPHNPRIAFRDFEAAARGGHAAAWFRLGRDYENFNDHTHAKDCFERGVKLGVESCLYRMGMAHLLGQLSLPANPSVALPLLHRAATLASVDVPQPAYVYALLLLAEFTQVTVPPSLFAPLIPPNSSPTLEARKHLERAAYLHFAAAQYKLGHAYEFAEPPFPFDPLLSVQYYSLASQQGESEADMALSKWFLCGSGGATVAGSTDVSAGFDKDEALALTFAEKAAKKGLPSAEFALGYYAEVGVGRTKDINEALMWYRKAAEHGNTDASARLSVLSGPAAQTLSRQEHDSITENKLVRRRTMAAQRAETQPLSPPWEGQTFPTLKEHQQQQQGPQRRADGRAVVDVIRKTSVLTQPVHQDSISETANRQYLPNWDNNPQQPVRTASPGAMGGGRRNQSPGRERIPRPDYQSTSNPPMPVGGQVQQGGGRLASPAPGGPGANAGRLNRLRLNLEDQGPVPSPPPQQQPPQTAVQPTPKPPQTAAPPKTGGKTPQTFAEMGFQGAKAEKDECIIM